MSAYDISKKIILRQKDEGKDLAKKINGFNLSLSRQLALIGDQNSKIAASLEKLENLLSQKDQDPEKISHLTGLIMESQKVIETEVSKYTLNSNHRP